MGPKECVVSRVVLVLTAGQRYRIFSEKRRDMKTGRFLLTSTVEERMMDQQVTYIA